MSMSWRWHRHNVMVQDFVRVRTRVGIDQCAWIRRSAPIRQIPSTLRRHDGRPAVAMGAFWARGGYGPPGAAAAALLPSEDFSSAVVPEIVRIRPTRWWMRFSETPALTAKIEMLRLWMKPRALSLVSFCFRILSSAPRFADSMNSSNVISPSCVTMQVFAYVLKG